MPQSFDYDISLLGMKKDETLFEFFCNGHSHPPEAMGAVRLKGSFLPNATLVCKVPSGLVKVFFHKRVFQKFLILIISGTPYYSYLLTIIHFYSLIDFFEFAFLNKSLSKFGNILVKASLACPKN